MTEPLEAHDQSLSKENLKELYKELNREHSEKEENKGETSKIVKTFNR